MGGEVVILANSLISHFQWGLRHSAMMKLVNLVNLVNLVKPSQTSETLVKLARLVRQVVLVRRVLAVKFFGIYDFRRVLAWERLNSLGFRACLMSRPLKKLFPSCWLLGDVKTKLDLTNPISF